MAVLPVFQGDLVVVREIAEALAVEVRGPQAKAMLAAHVLLVLLVLAEEEAGQVHPELMPHK
jgi:hypothetical protein